MYVVVVNDDCDMNMTYENAVIVMF